MNVIVIFGATASGKSKVSIELAKLIDGEIISADSMQIYKGLNIGTAKVTLDEMEGVAHHMIDVVESTQKFSVSDYKEMATMAIKDILSRKRQPIICGGTGLYLDALIKNIDFESQPMESEVRKQLILEHLQHGNSYMHEKLKQIDPISAQNIHENNTKRVIRAIEATMLKGIPFSQQKENAVENKSEFEFKLYGLEVSRGKLYERINLRVVKMFRDGLENEVANLFENGLLSEITASQAIGYKEFVPYFEGGATLDEVKEKIKMETRRYAKRQNTWFKRYIEAKWIDCNVLSAKEAAEVILASNLQ